MGIPVGFTNKRCGHEHVYIYVFFLNYTRMGKDRQGKWRGKCTASDCDCALYTKDDPKDKLRCDYCDHIPGAHALLGKCLGCEQCESYEVDDEEELGGKGECSYCSCDAEKHEVAKGKSAEMLQTGARTMPSSTSSPAVPPATTSNSPSVMGLTHQPMGTTGPGGQRGLLCKFPGCQKQCFVEGQKMHDFCSRTHASAYFTLQSGGPMSSQPRATMTYSQRHPEMPQYSTAPLVPQPDTMQPPGKPANYSSAYAPPPLPSMQTGGPPPPTPAGSSSIPICRNPDCQRPCYVEGDKVFDYCGRTCRNKHAS